MTDMNTGMPFWWTGANPANVTPPQQALTNNLAQNTAMNRASSAATSKASADVGSNANTFDPFAQSGGFGKQTDYYSSLGAAFGRATGGFNAKPGDYGTKTNPFGANGNLIPRGVPSGDVTRGPDLPSPNTNRDTLAGYYYLNNPDVWNAGKTSGKDPTTFANEHFKLFGQNENRQFFDPEAYLQQNKDVADAGANPFEHYLTFGQKEGRAMPTGEFDPASYYRANPDVAEAGADAFQHWSDFGQKENRAGGWEWGSRNRGTPAPARMEATPAIEGSDPILAVQRQPYANSVRNNPEKRILFAARLHSELGNDPEGRTAITEAMLNRLNSRKLDPLDARYYPRDAAAVKHYNESLALMRRDPSQVDMVMRDAERAFGGSNYSKHATDWASQVAGMTVAERARANATATWTSPRNEEFFRRDLTGTDTGDPAARQIQRWYNSVNVPTAPP